MLDKNEIGYENYERTSSSYDDIRQAVGLELVLGAIAATTSLSKSSVLDVGCGTGNYLKALAPHVGKIVGIDGSEGMLKQALKKTKDLPEVSIELHNLVEKLPFESQSFDAIVCNQVLHHLVLPNSKNPFGYVLNLFREIDRLLIKGGVFVLNFSTPKQQDAFWWFHFLPKTKAKAVLLAPETQWLIEIFEKQIPNRYKVKSFILNSETLMRRKDYLNIAAALDPNWRNCDSSWALAPANEYQNALDQIQKLSKKPEQLAQFIQEQKYILETIGQSTTICFTKA